MPVKGAYEGCVSGVHVKNACEGCVRGGACMRGVRDWMHANGMFWGYVSLACWLREWAPNDGV